MNPYATLGVSRSDRRSSIAAAYHDLSRKLHVASQCAAPWASDLETSLEMLMGGRPRERAEAEPAGVVDLLDDFEAERPSREEVRAVIRKSFTPLEPKSATVELLELWLLAPEPVEILLAVPVYHPCSTCKGTGRIDLYLCGDCEGEGLAEERAAVPLVIAEERVISLAAVGIRSPVLRVRRVSA